MGEKIKNIKIIINKDDELTDIVSAILEADSERIILTFAEESDILISPINLSVLLDTADEEDKLLVAQIIKNPTGLRNSAVAGLITTDSPSGPTEDLWEEALKKKNERLEPKPTEKEVKEEVETETKESLFEKKINDAIQRSREEIKNKKTNKTIEEDGLLLSLDEDLPKGEEKVDEIIIEDNNKILDTPEKEEIVVKIKKPKVNIFKNFDIKKLWPFKKIEGDTRISKFRKLIPIVILSLVLVAAFSIFIYIQTVPFVKVAIYVEAKEVSIDKIFIGDQNITELDLTALKVPIKADSVEKDRSSSIKATGKAYKGDKATGKVNLIFNKTSCVDVSPISLNSGHVISTSGKAYALDSATTINCNSLSEATVRAVEIGTEYNIEASQSFIVQGYQSTELFGFNSSAFTGGTKQEYTVLSQKDVDTGAEDLKETAVEEGTTELREKNTDWTIIDDSIECDVVKDSVKTSIAVGASASDVDLSVKVSCSATYYLTEGLDGAISTLLTEEAVKQNLFEEEGDLELVLAENVDKTITIEESKDGSIKIKLVAKGNVRPKIDKEAIVNELKGDKWEEGLNYIKSLKFSDKESTASFFPKNFLSRYPYFPKRQGGVIVEIHDM